MARNSINVRIGLDGGKLVESQLKDLGEAGEKAFDQIRKAAVKVDLAKFGDSISKFSNDLATVGRRVSLALGALAAAGGTAGLAVFGLAKSGAAAADEAGKAAQATGLQVEAYGKLAFAAEMADVSQQEFVAGMSRLNKAIAEAAAKSASAAGKIGNGAKGAARNIRQSLGNSVETFDHLGVRVTRFGDDVGRLGDKAKASGERTESAFVRLGIQVTDANGRLRSTEKILEEVANAFKRLPEGPQKSALAMDLFGRSGANLLPFLNQGAEGLRELGRAAEENGQIFTAEQAAIGDALGDALDNLGKSVSGIRNQLGLIFAPAFTIAAEEFRDMIVANKDAILAFGRTTMVFGVRVVQDLLNILIGNEAKVRYPWIVHWRNAIVDFGAAVTSVVRTVVIPLFTAVREGAQLVADGINNIFGTKMTGGELLVGAALLKLLGVFRLLASAAGVAVAGIKLLGGALALAFSGGVVAAASSFWGVLVRGAALFLPLVAGLVSWPALIVAGVAAAGAAIYLFWDDIVGAAKVAWNTLASLFSPEGMAAIWAGILSGTENAGRLFVDAWKMQVQAVGAVFAGLRELITAFVAGALAELGSLASELLPTWDQIKQAGADAWAFVQQTFTDMWSSILLAVSNIGAAFGQAWDVVRAGAAAAWESLKSTVLGIVSSMVSDAVRLINGLITRIANAIAKLKELVGLSGPSKSSGGSASGAHGFAGGGAVRGPGSATSDSILARLSNGEFVIQAAAVRKFGVGFFDMLNRGLLPAFKGFNMGGFVDGLNRSLAIPHFAGGGPVNFDALAPASGAMKSFDLHIHNGGESRVFRGVLAPNDVARAMAKFATQSSYASAGRKPRGGH